MLTDKDLLTLQKLDQVGGSSAPKLAAIFGIRDDTMRERLKRLQSLGLIELRGKTWVVTAEGHKSHSVQQASEQLPREKGSLLADTNIRRILEALPLPEFRALLRISLALALLRQHFPEVGLMPWIGAYGRPGTGKTTVGEIALHLVGGHMFRAGNMTAAEVIGRKVQAAQGKWSVVPPLTCDGPVTVLDELQTAKNEVRTSIFALIDEKRYIRIEGENIEQKAAVFATWNNAEGEDIPLEEGARRRGIVMSTEPYTEKLQKFFMRGTGGDQLRQQVNALPVGYVDLSLYKVRPVHREHWEKAKQVLFDSLTLEGRQSPVGALGSLGAAYAALYDLNDHQALGEVLGDFCLILATRAGNLTPDWKVRVNQFRTSGDLPEVSPTPAERNSKLVQGLQKTGQKAEYQHTTRKLSEFLRGIPEDTLNFEQQKTKARLLEQLHYLGERIPHQSEDSYPEIEAILQESMKQARHLVDVVSRTYHRNAEELKYRVQEAQKAYQDAVLEQEKCQKYTRYLTELKHNAELFMEECARRGWVQKVDETPSRKEMAPTTQAFFAGFALLTGQVDKYLETSTREREEKWHWVQIRKTKEGKPETVKIKDLGVYIGQVLSHFRQLESQSGKRVREAKEHWERTYKEFQKLKPPKIQALPSA